MRSLAVFLLLCRMAGAQMFPFPGPGLPPPTSQVATPTDSASGGGCTGSSPSWTCTGATSITLNTATGGSTICYTVDNSPPVCGSGTTVTYSGSPFTSPSSTFTLKAYATHAGMSNSGVLTSNYSISGGTVITLLTGGNGYQQCESGANGCTTPSIDTSLAKLLVGIDCVYTGGPGFGFTDNKGNTWTPLTTYTLTPGGEQCRIVYSTNPTVGTGHIFGDSGSGSYAAVGVLAFAGADTTAPFVTSSDVGTASSGVTCSGITPCGPGSVSIATGNVEVALFFIPFGIMTTGVLPNDTDYVIDGSIHSGSNEGFTVAHLIPVTTASRNPQWEVSGGGSVTGTVSAASFKHQ